MKTLINDIKKFKSEIESFDADFGYVSSKGEVACQIWHRLTVMQRHEIAKSKNINGCCVAAISACYDAVAEMM